LRHRWIQACEDGALSESGCGVRIGAIGAAALVLCLWIAAMGLLPSSHAAEATEGPLVLVHDASGFFLDAHGVSVAEVLAALGARAGFSVVDTGPTRRPLVISIAHATLDELLRRLLVAEDHLIVYEKDSQAEARVAQIVLFGPIEQPPAISAVRDEREPTPPLLTASRSEHTASRPQHERATTRQGDGSQESPPGMSGGDNALTDGSSTLSAVPELLRQHILERISVLIDTVRRATLDGNSAGETTRH